MFIKLARASLMMSMLTVSIVSQASDDHVQRDVSLLQDMVVNMQVIIDRIEARQSRIAPNATYYFDTKQLSRDLYLVSEGIDNFLLPARRPARYVVPIKGDYLDQR